MTPSSSDDLIGESNPVPSGSEPPLPTELKEVVARMAEFAQLSPPGAVPTGATLDLLKDVPITITARLGQTVLPIGEILKLGPGAVIELDRDIAQPVELTVRGLVFARGDVVVVDNHFAIRIRELMTPKSKR
jgi:flagellar motor switch protein FliN